MVGLASMFRPMAGGDTGFAAAGFIIVKAMVAIVVLYVVLGIVFLATFALRAQSLRAVMR